MTSLKPLGNRVIVKRSKVKTTKGGILLPDSAQEKPKEGTVIAVGPGKRDDDGKIEEMPIKIGDVVLFGSYAGTSVNVNGEQDEDGELLILSVDEIFGIIAA